ncbi:MAG: ComF family protein [Coriobacteriia bacterium]
MLLSGFLELIAPPRCAGCDLPGAVLCAACAAAIVRTDVTAVCPRCGAPGNATVCLECDGREFGFSSALSVGSLEPPLSRAITLYKDSGERRYATILGSLLADAVTLWRGWPQSVMPIPPTRGARARRGFDHTLSLARAVAASVGAPVERRLAVSGRRDQRVLGRAARFENMAGAFSVLGEAPIAAHVLLVDDVMTTGATLEAASRALLAAGATEVRVVVLARA